MTQPDLPDLELTRPATIEEAVKLKARLGNRAVFMGGGSGLAPRLGRERRTVDLAGVERIISLEDIPELVMAQSDDQGWTAIGAMACLAQMGQNEWLHQYHPLLAQASALAAARPGGEFSTLGGNLCADADCPFLERSAQWWAERPDCLKLGGSTCLVDEKAQTCQALSGADIPPVLLALHAEVEVTGPGGTRRLTSAELFSNDGVRPLTLDRDELVTFISVPPPVPNWREIYLTDDPTGDNQPASVSLALRIRYIEGHLMNARLVLGSMGSGPVRATEAEKLLIEAGPSRQTFDRAAGLAVEQLMGGGLVSAAFAPPRESSRAAKSLISLALERLVETG